jgi:4-hydroxythreonine-4-phosphate dehydrogenase
MSATPAPLVLTMGEPAGIGPEITLKAWSALKHDPAYCFCYVGYLEQLREIGAGLSPAVPAVRVDDISKAAEAFATGVPVLALDQPSPVPLGIPVDENAPAVIKAIELAVQFAGNGNAAAMVTNPINKDVLSASGFQYTGHTDFLGALTKQPAAPVMMLASDKLKVVPVTVHMALAEVPEKLSTQAIVHAGKVTTSALKLYFGVAEPLLAVAGLNPHAGDGGLFGHEEAGIIVPAIEQLKASVSVAGPFAADSLFHDAARTTYDAVLCMYHDQALIPIKTLGFFDAVNVTLGLDIIRTSPDHGTALDIAGAGLADPSSLLAALKMAADMAAGRSP